MNKAITQIIITAAGIALGTVLAQAWVESYRRGN